MENGNTEQTVKPNNRKRRRNRNGNYRTAVIVLSILLLASVLYSGFQTLYIFRLNTGLEGILSYSKNSQTSGSTAGAETVPVSAENLPEPWFSLEEATSAPSADKQKKPVVDIVKAVSPATVSLSIIGVDDGKETKLSSGTGFIITEDGYIVTNQHVVVLADNAVSTYYVTVILPGETEPVRAEVVGTDVQTDIAVLKVETDKKLPCVVMGDSDTLQSGELAITIGNSMGTLDDTVTVGVISAPSRELNRSGYRVDIIQTDAAINPGNSGGPLINSFGEVVGIINSKMVSSTSENVGFAIPINTAKPIIEDLINYGKVVGRAFLGFSVKLVTDDSYYGADGGIFVMEIVENGPAAKAGFVLGDKIISIDGVEIKDTGDIIKVRDAHEVGEDMTVIVEREGKQVTLILTIGDSADY